MLEKSFLESRIRDGYSLNGKILGKTQDIFQSEDILNDILIAPLNEEFEKMRDNNVKLRILFSGDVYYTLKAEITSTTCTASAYQNNTLLASTTATVTGLISNANVFKLHGSFDRYSIKYIKNIKVY